MPTQPPPIPPDTCPACGAYAGHKPAIRLKESFNVFALIGGGIFAVVLLNAGRAKRVQCNACGALFSIRPPGSKIMLLFFWLLVAPTILFIAAYLAYQLWTLLTGS